MYNSIFQKFLGEKVRDENLAKCRAIGKIAEEHGYSQAALALGWAIATPDTSTALLGFSRVSQIDDNLGAIKVLQEWTPELEKKIHDVLNNAPVLENNWRNWQPEKPRRLEGIL